MKTAIFLKSLAIITKIGINPDERLYEQTIFIDLSFEYNQKKAALSDDINNAISYDALATHIKDFAVIYHFDLVESFIYYLAQSIFQKFNGNQLKIKIKKRGAISNCKNYGAIGKFKKTDFESSKASS